MERPHAAHCRSEIVETFELLTGEDMYSASKEARTCSRRWQNWAAYSWQGHSLAK